MFLIFSRSLYRIIVIYSSNMNMTISFDLGTFIVMVIVISATERLLLDLSPSKSLHQLYYYFTPDCRSGVQCKGTAAGCCDK